MVIKISSEKGTNVGTDIEQALALDQRFQALEDRITSAVDGLGLANPFSTTATSDRVIGQVSGLGITKNVGTLTPSWAPVNLKNLRYYEVEISEQADFLNATTFTTVETSFTYVEGDPTIPYFVRVRAVALDGRVGAWSATLNTLTGKASFNNLQQGAAGNTIVISKSSFNPSVLVATGTLAERKADFIDLDFETVDSESDIFIFATAKADYKSQVGDTLYLRIILDGSVIQEYENRTDAGFSSTARITVPGLGLPVVTTAGEHNLTFQIEIEDTNSDSLDSRITPQDIKITLFERRR